MNDNTQALSTIVTGSSLDLALSAWLHKHGKRIEIIEDQEVIHHTRTSKAHEETMRQFRAGLQREGLDLKSDLEKVALLAQAFADGSTRSPQVKATTAMCAWLSSPRFTPTRRSSNFLMRTR